MIILRSSFSIFFFTFTAAAISNQLNAMENPLLNKLRSNINDAKSLVCAIYDVQQQCSLETTIDLLKTVLNTTGQSFFKLKGNDDNTVLHYACRDKYPIEVVAIILQVAGTDVGKLICTKNWWGQTALYSAVNNVIQYNGSLEIVEKLLMTSSPGDRWNLINEKCLRHCTGGDCSVLMYAKSYANPTNYQLINLLHLYGSQ